jgi:hypothetical protein
MRNRDKDKAQDRGGTAANAESLLPTRRQFLKGVATAGPVAIAAAAQTACGPAIPPLKTSDATVMPDDVHRCSSATMTSRVGRTKLAAFKATVAAIPLPMTMMS